MSFKQKIPPLSIIVALDEHGGFAKDGKIPWDIPEDMKHFMTTTKGGVCIMGRSTYEDMLVMRKERDEKKGKTDPIEEILPGRECYVVTSNEKFEAPGATVVPSIRTAIQNLTEEDKRTIFVIGGLRMWTEALPWVETAYVTVIKGTFDCDRFFPVELLNRAFVIVDGEEKENLYFTTYKRSRL